MNKLIFSTLLVAMLQYSFAQTNMKTKYDSKWKSVENAFSKGLDKTAQSEIEAILKMAKSENNTEQIVKALCNYRVSLRDRDEKARLNDILLFEKELTVAKFPIKQILHSMLGDLYWTYYDENRWKILDRTQIANEKLKNENSDIETWTATDFYNTAYKHFNASLSESEKSKNFQLKNIAAILSKGIHTEKLRPTLYDFLVHRAINYFSREENELTKPAYSFEIHDEKAFSPAAVFSKALFKTTDTISQKYQVIKLYQDILQFHLNDADPSAWIDADLARIRYVKEHTTLSNKNDLYLKALQNIASTYPNNEQAAMASFYIAEVYTRGEGGSYKRGMPQIGMQEDKINYIEAKKICNAILEKFSNSEASYNAQSLLQQIETPSLSIQTEKVVLPNQPSLAKINYRNIPTLYCKLVKLTPKEYKNLNYDYNHNYTDILGKTAFKNWSIALPNPKDFKPHSTEIKVDALPLGTYALLISEANNFNGKSYTAVSFLNVSNISYVYASNNLKGGSEVYVMHRDTGEPLENVQVKTWTNIYDYKSRKYEMKQGPDFKTDKNGYFKMTRNDPNQGGYALEFIRGDDNLFLNDNVYVQENNTGYNDYTRTFLFTDRSIYRPGQNIYFKGIMVLTKGNENKTHELIKNRKTTVQLRDVNSQVVKEIELTTNEFGSYAGTFTAPDGLLTGQFQIVAESGVAYINVEEYKRPKFEVTYDTIKGTYRLNDEIKVKGLAKAFAGNNIDGATVKYRVVREARFPYYWCFYRWGQPSSPSMEISNGTVKTKADGSFDISFIAMPDNAIDKKTMPIFDYKVYADVTDLNGETRSGSTDISVSYQSLMLRLDLPEQMDFNDFNALHIYSTNLAGTYIPTEVNLTCKKLLAPIKTYRSRLWEMVEIQSIPENEFRKDFPLDEYKDENDYLKWKEEKTVWTKTISSQENGLEYLQKIANHDGWYVIEAKAKDANGEEVMDKKYIRLSTYSNPEALPNEHLLVSKVKLRAEPGEVARIGISSPFEKIFLLYNIERNKTPNSEWISFAKNKFFEFNIKDEDRGGFALSALFVKNNRVYRMAQFIDVPWTNKDLNISLETFRDKILPGSEQEWKVKISGSKKEKVSAELLATMYDASLDAFKPHSFNGFDFFQNNYQSTNWNTASGFSLESGRQISYRLMNPIPAYEKLYSQLEWWGLTDYGGQFYLPNVTMRGGRNRAFAQKSYDAPSASSEAVGVAKGLTEDDAFAPPPPPAAALFGKQRENKILADSISLEGQTKTENIQIRSNFSETAFFFPQLQTDLEGNILLKFKAPDALTRWKLMAFGHTQNLQSGQMSSTTTTQKELMIVPNTPRFLREGDKMVYSAKVTNLSDKDVEGKATLQIIDAFTENYMDSLFKNTTYDAIVKIKKGESQSVQWKIEIPIGFTHPVKIKTTVQAGSFADGEQNLLPILLNSILVSETLPLPVRINSIKNFSFKNLLASQANAKESTLRHYNLTVEYTGNPAWYAVQALPYLTDYPYECAEQTFNRYYANVLATHMANSSPKVKEIFSSWENKDTTALLSNLQKNQELKSALLQETPWVLEAKNEEQQKRNIATLFNLNRMSKELERTVRELEILQTPNGGFTWFKGMPDDRFVTQYILTGIGRLLHIGVSEVGSERRIMQIIEKAIPYLDARLKDDYDYLIKHKANLKVQQIGYTQIQYLYMRSYFLDKPVGDASKTAFDFYKNQAAKYWLNTNRYMQGMAALALSRGNDKITPQAILKSLRENAIRSEEMGMYWKEVGSSYWWYEAPIETQSLLVEAFKELAGNEEELDELKIWLLKNKQTQNWKTTKATADAVYALLLNGSEWLANQPEVEISLGEKKIFSKEQKQEAGTGYFKINIPAEEIKSEMGNIQVKVSAAGKGTSWGAVYWQYFENLDKIKSAVTPLSLKKQLFIEKNSDKGPILVPISNNASLEVGDKVKVRIELRVDRDMEYLHMKDMRGACFEPINVLSQYKFQGGLGYYEATKDAATNFFFHWLQKGTYVFEYPMFVTNKGDYSNGICTIQCMYAPEFSSHSEGLRVQVK